MTQGIRFCGEDGAYFSIVGTDNLSMCRVIVLVHGDSLTDLFEVPWLHIDWILQGLSGKPMSYVGDHFCIESSKREKQMV